jgi:hypothetical protein
MDENVAGYSVRPRYLRGDVYLIWTVRSTDGMENGETVVIAMVKSG